MKKLLCISILIIGYSHAFLEKQIDTYLSDKPKDTFTAILKSWYNEDPEIFHATQLAPSNTDVTLTLTDMYAIRAEARKLIPQKDLEGRLAIDDRYLKQSAAIAEVLKNLGIPLTLSSEQIADFAKEFAEEVEKRGGEGPYSVGRISSFQEESEQAD